VLLDAEELEAALQEGQITEAQYNLAWQEARTLLRDIASGAMPLLDLTVDHLLDCFGS
jgi:predicted RNA-binding protein associated with RNAse of E/G family